MGVPYWMSFQPEDFNALLPKEHRKLKEDVEKFYRRDFPEFEQILLHPVCVPWMPEEAGIKYLVDGKLVTKQQLWLLYRNGTRKHLGLTVRFDGVDHALIVERPPGPKIPCIRRVMSARTQRFLAYGCFALSAVMWGVVIYECIWSEDEIQEL